MKIFVTGLCLQGNKGGMALAQALKAVLENHFIDADFTFSVPSGEYEEEKRWGLKLHLDVVRKISIKDYLPPWIFSNLSQIRRKEFLSVLRNADLVVDLTALTYVGPPKGKTIGPIQTRFLYFILTRVYRKHFLAWTQTYGPFSNLPIKLMAKLDLNNQPVIFCRGTDCEREVKDLLPQKHTEVFPDVACLLPYDKNEGARILKELNVDTTRIVTLSPSSVLYQSGHVEGSVNKHIDLCGKIIAIVRNYGYNVVLVPHCYRPNRSEPDRCDKAVCDIIMDLFESENLTLVDHDYSATDLKSIISNAAIHIGARYHSVIAALSSGVPCLSMSWHPKYRDAMQIYGMADLVLDASVDFEKNGFSKIFDDLVENRDRLAKMLGHRQHEVDCQIARNAEQFAGIYSEKLLKKKS